jgi:hypothetical protein
MGGKAPERIEDTVQLKKIDIDIKTDTRHIEVHTRRLRRVCSLISNPVWNLWEEGRRVAPEGTSPAGAA